MQFIQDVIYDLRMEYGIDGSVVNETFTTNLESGVKTKTTDTFTVVGMIPLPYEIKRDFLRTLQGQNAGYLEIGEEEILIDKDMIPSGKTLGIGSQITLGGKTVMVTRIGGDFTYALILVCKAPV